MATLEAVDTAVANQIDGMIAVRDAAIVDAQNFLNQLESVTFSQPPYFTPNFTNINVSTIPIDADVPERPNIDSIMTDVAIPALAEIVIPDFLDLAIPTIPVKAAVQLNADFVFSEAGYTSELLESVKAKLLFDLAEGGVGLDPNIENGYWTRKKERDEIALSEARQKLAAQWGRSRFKLPTGALNAALLDLENTAMLSRMDSSRDIAIKQVELALSNKQFTITNSIALEQLTIQHYHNLMTRALQAASYVAEFGINFYNAKRTEFLDDLAMWKGQLEGVNLQYQGQNLKMDAVKLQAAIEVQRLEAYKTRIGAFLDKVRALTTIYTADTDVYRVQISKGTAEAEIKLKQADIVMRNADGNMRLAIENSKIALQAFMDTQNTKIATIKAGADAFGNTAAAAMQAVSTITQLGYMGEKSE